jgi:hypothetical protein
MLICIDFDETYTADPKMWDSIIQIMKFSGHKVICATMRYPSEGAEVQQYLGGKVDMIYYTSRKAKMVYLSEINVCPDIWIDDKPVWLFQDG